MNAMRRPAVSSAVAGLLLALFLQLTFAASRNSATFDEPAHIYAGYLQWAHGFYTLNPPLTRYVLAAPLVGMKLKEPSIQNRPLRMHEMEGGREFVFQEGAGEVLFRSRMAVVALGLFTALLVFWATKEMFGVTAGVIALALLAFDPTFLAHSSLATTDTGQALFMFWAVYLFYRYLKEPGLLPLAAVSIVVGLAVAAKSSAVQLFPDLALLALVEVFWGRKLGGGRPGEKRGPLARRLLGALAVIAISSLAILWASYGFRYVPAEGGPPLNPPMQVELALVPSALEARLLAAADGLHLLPQAYTYGFAHFLYEARAFPSYVLGRTYPHAVWFFFPIAMAIKSSLTFLVLVAAGAFSVFTGRVEERRGIVTMVIPATVYMVIAMTGGMNIGIRHVLPVYVFMAAAVGGAVSALVKGRRPWLLAVLALLVFQAVSVLHAFPAYIAYANEAFGGPSSVHKYLSDSSSDWGQQLKAVKAYTDARGLKDCWFAYFAEGPLDYRYYGIPCKPLLTPDALSFSVPFDVPPSIDGPVLMSAGTLSGFELGPAPLNAYEQFKTLKPVAVIDYGVFVFEGHFDLPLAAALSHVQKAGLDLRSNEPEAALAEARQAETLAPDSARVLAMVGQALDANRRPDEAALYAQKALAIARTVQPEFQARLIAALRGRVEGR
ncbi:MAG TPA: glycosyltransferase family 39 protein [Vicinamibacteria bacterium]|nr:glycosyltransferase family 39 protein [Vicinamibacteria bacterium]